MVVIQKRSIVNITVDVFWITTSRLSILSLSLFGTTPIINLKEYSSVKCPNNIWLTSHLFHVVESIFFCIRLRYWYVYCIVWSRDHDDDDLIVRLLPNHPSIAPSHVLVQHILKFPPFFFKKLWIKLYITYIVY